jgi:hypothetical protein
MVGAAPTYLFLGRSHESFRALYEEKNLMGEKNSTIKEKKI